MRFRTSIGSFRFTLLTAMGFGSLTACSGTVISRNSSGIDGGSTGGAGHSTGGAVIAGAPSGGAPIGGAGGAPTGGAATGGVLIGGTGGAGGARTCANPVPFSSSVTGSGPSGGYVRCDDGVGWVHRPDVDECWSNIDPQNGPTPTGWPDASVTWGCRKNSDCSAAPHGHCETSPMYGFGGAPTISCQYGCVRDSECPTGQICFCGEPVGTCVAATCTSDADCAAGTPCQMGVVNQACGPATISFQCGPLCAQNADCPQNGSFSMTCEDGNCRANAVCGRPFLVRGEARLAALAPRSDWASKLSPDVASLPLDARRLLAEHYTAIGLMEHASVAAFARFSLELLSLGAPADIVRLAGEALGDETRHARLCFGLASAYAGRDLGPGPLEIGGALEDTPLIDKLRIAFVEACLGETCAAVEAAEAAMQTSDPVVASVLRGISADETRHAELGWKFIKWALDRMDAATRAGLLRELAVIVERELECSDVAAESTAHSEPLAAHGVLPASVRAALRKATIREAVLPCLNVLAASSRIGSSQSALMV